MVAISQTKLRSASRRRRKRSAQIQLSKTRRISAILRLLVLFLLVFFVTLWILLHKLKLEQSQSAEKENNGGIVLSEGVTNRNSTTSSASSLHTQSKIKQLLHEVQHPQQQPPRKMSSTKNPIYFMHIGKTGGTSLLHMMQKLNHQKKFQGKPWIRKGQSHFDWTYLQQKLWMEQKQQLLHAPIRAGSMVTDTDTDEIDETLLFDVSNVADVISLLREPVSRATSQFYYSQQKSHNWDWVVKLKQAGTPPAWTLQNINEYMNDENNRTFTQPLTDGDSGVKYFAGTWGQNDWLLTDGKESSEVKKYLRQNYTAAVLVAAKRLEQTIWFGLLEEKEKSMELLQMTLGLDVPPTLPEANVLGLHKPPPSNETKQKIASYLPMDTWLYNYAKMLFEARWNYFFNNGGDGSYIHPELPPLPNFSATVVQ